MTRSRDPPSYFEDHQQQYLQYQSQRDLLLQNPSSSDDTGLVRLSDLIDFVAHTADCYPKATAQFSEDLIQILSLHHDELQPDLRDKMVGSLVLLRNKELIDSATLLNTLFPILVSTRSKSLRALLFTKIISDLRSANVKATNHRLNRTIQTVIFVCCRHGKSSGVGSADTETRTYLPLTESLQRACGLSRVCVSSPR